MTFEDLSYKRWDEFPEAAHEVARADSDDPDDPREEIQTTILKMRGPE